MIFIFFFKGVVRAGFVVLAFIEALGVEEAKLSVLHSDLLWTLHAQVSF